MRVMNVLIGSQDGGAEAFFMRFGAAMQRRGIEQLMVMSPHELREQYFSSHSTPYLCIEFEAFFGFLGKWRMRQAIRRYQPDVIIAWMNRAARRLPRQTTAVKIGRLGGPYGISHYKYCDYMVVNSEPLASLVRKQGRQDVTCIANFVELEKENVPSLASDHARPRLFFHGRLHPQKGLDVLLEAMQHIDADLHIAGAGALESELKQQVQSLQIEDKVTFLGWIQNASELMQNSDVYVFPSRYEGTSNSLLEAMAYGKPIVTTNGESVSWFLTHEENALIVDMDDAKAIEEAVNRLLTQPELARRLGDNARKLYQERFNEEAICNEWISFCETALEKRKMTR